MGLTKGPRIFGTAGHGFFPQYEPMRRDRWVLTIDGAMFHVRLDSRPTIEQRVEEIPSSTYIRGPLHWNPIEIEVIDPIGDGSIEIIREWMVQIGSWGVARGGYRGETKKTIQLEQVDPVGSTISKWVLYGTEITEMNYEMVYDQEIGNMKMKIQFDNAQLIL